MPSPQVYSAVDVPIENYFPGSLFMVVVSFGTGKLMLANALPMQDSSIRLSVSATTRESRPGEQHGHEYNFMTVEEFKACCGCGELLEWAEMHDNYYATSRVWIKEQVRVGTDVPPEINQQGAQQVHQCFSNAVGVFILPPSLFALEERLERRGRDESSMIVYRLLAADSEMMHAPKADYVITNGVFDVILTEPCTMVQATRLHFSAWKARHGELSVELGIH